jgi:PhnB protein
MQLTTYLLFAGDCKEAMTFYHAIFAGELVITTVGDSPMNVFLWQCTRKFLMPD